MLEFVELNSIPKQKILWAGPDYTGCREIMLSTLVGPLVPGFRQILVNSFLDARNGGYGNDIDLYPFKLDQYSLSTAIHVFDLAQDVFIRKDQPAALPDVTRVSPSNAHTIAPVFAIDQYPAPKEILPLVFFRQTIAGPIDWTQLDIANISGADYKEIKEDLGLLTPEMIDLKGPKELLEQLLQLLSLKIATYSKDNPKQLNLSISNLKPRLALEYLLATNASTYGMIKGYNHRIAIPEE